MFDNPFGEDIFSNAQSKPSPVQLEAISSCPVTCYLGEETNTHLTTSCFQVAVESNKVSPQPPLLQTKKPQLPQLFLIRLVLQIILQTPHQLFSDTLQHLNVLLVVRGPKLNTVLGVQPHQCQVQGHDPLPTPAGHPFLTKARMLLAFLATRAHCWLTFSQLSTSTPSLLSSHSSSSI